MSAKKEKVLAEKLPLILKDYYLGLITLNQPEKMNPFDWDIVLELRKITEKMDKDETVRVIAFTGSGKAFSAGGNMAKYLNLYKDDEGYLAFVNDIHSLFDLIELMGKPAIALVNGYCVAGGLELLLACDFAYAAESAKIGDGHVNFGQMGGGGDLGRLARYISPPKARELLYTGKLLGAREALEWGLVNRVVPNDKLIESALEFANNIATKSALGVRNMKQVVNQGLLMSKGAALYLERRVAHHYCCGSYDAYEGLKAFAEKRKPQFKGR